MGYQVVYTVAAPQVSSRPPATCLVTCAWGGGPAHGIKMFECPVCWFRLNLSEKIWFAYCCRYTTNLAVTRLPCPSTAVLCCRLRTVCSLSNPLPYYVLCFTSTRSLFSTLTMICTASYTQIGYTLHRPATLGIAGPLVTFSLP